MQKVKTIKIVKMFGEKLKKEKFPFSSIYFFGSRAKGINHKDSDIDVAVVSDKLKNRHGRNYFKLWKYREDVDYRIEPHCFSLKDFNDPSDPLVSEIKKTGIRVV